MPQKIVRFKRSPEGLYFHQAPKKYKATLDKPIDMKISQMVATVSENMKDYMSQQCDHAKAARKLYHNVGTPTIESFQGITKVEHHTELPGNC